MWLFVQMSAGTENANELHLISCYTPVPCALNLFLLLSLGQCRLQGVQVSPQLMQFPLQLPSLVVKRRCVAFFFLQALI